MARILGVDLPRNKRVEIALTYIYGIASRPRAAMIAKQVGIPHELRPEGLTDEHIAKNSWNYRTKFQS